MGDLLTSGTCQLTRLFGAHTTTELIRLSRAPRRRHRLYGNRPFRHRHDHWL